MNLDHTVIPMPRRFGTLNTMQREKRKSGGAGDGAVELNARLGTLRSDLLALGDEDPRRGEILMEMGTLLARLGDHAAALDAYDRCRLHASAVGELPLQARTLDAIAMLHLRRGEYPAALAAYLDCIRLRQEESGPDVAGAAWMQIGVIYGHLEHHDRAIECFQRSAQIFEDAGQLYLKVRALVNIANTLRARGDLPAALDAMMRVLMIFEELDDRGNIAEALAIISNIHERQGELDIALDYSRRALESTDRAANPILFATLLMNIGSIYRKQGNLPAATASVTRGLGLVTEAGSPLLECQLHELAALIYEEGGDAAMALKHHKRFARAREEFARRKGEEQINELQIRFDVEQMARDRDLYRAQAWELRREVHDKTKELTAVTLSLVQKSEFLDQMKGQLADILAATKERSNRIVRPMIDEMTAGANTEEGWRMFEQQFDNVHRDFMRTLAERYPSLTPMELKVCALTKMDLSTKEIAKMLFVSVRNVQNHRYRLRKKLKLDPEANLVSFLTGI
jgi:tetratricopeptide (TPR) repeat protein/DNA-binding CsgD family transcriptional regulator